MNPRLASRDEKFSYDCRLPVIVNSGRPSWPCWQTTTGRFSPGVKSVGTSKMPYRITSG